MTNPDSEVPHVRPEPHMGIVGEDGEYYCKMYSTETRSYLRHNTLRSELGEMIGRLVDSGVDILKGIIRTGTVS